MQPTTSAAEVVSSTIKMAGHFFFQLSARPPPPPATLGLGSTFHHPLVRNRPFVFSPYPATPLALSAPIEIYVMESHPI